MTSPTHASSAPAKILLVGNNKAGAAARKVVLEEQGYTVKTATSAEDALHLFNAETFDLVITAYRLGSHAPNGGDLIARLREAHPALPVVLISSVAEVLGLSERSTGADAIIQKSSTEVAHMLRAVHRLLTRRQTPKKPPALERPATAKAGRRTAGRG
jgi:CheY-like chemotaxis protein